MSDALPIQNGLKQEDALFTTAFKLCLKILLCNEGGLELNGTYQLLFMLTVIIYWAKKYIP
jgi:hypothetical protein